MTSYVVVIPARLGSSRLARKPLADIGGKSMIQHTYERALEAVPADKVYVATDSTEITEACAGFGAQAVMTSTACLTGTDRIAEFAEKIPADLYINLQGDEPLMEPVSITRVLEASLAAPDQIVNGWAWIESEEEYRSRSIPKVVLREDGRMMYMSRSPIPGTKSDAFVFSRKQICVYGFPRDALRAFAERGAKTAHEEAEDIEILRFAEMGWDISMIELPGSSIAVDTPADLERVRALVAARA
ncbi:3-deoxy-manno-octulosonate cytidylyltransferase [Aestuariivita sp.]|jgi:3-deoxy-manno-octulosonate cytidylyltransferase (CMP-KDO synthetase)|uniref:3-deoxy-manno-octulosonate cytidylyltransferase n=1 Tax=Aestuariivita sp. TaxID=1872407 RepID=UPI00216D7391|nr:3-deoxy-manno-octulosonate cytidylyltransferase [Aestuariivita sp.]MCE8009734.1 3-deoxy-manno-octulosonate cytidylyltransferase [Aestuariivita sp.]